LKPRLDNNLFNIKWKKESKFKVYRHFCIGA